MRYLLLLLLTFNAYSEVKFTITDLRNNSIQGTSKFNTNQEAINRLTKIAKIKKSWRKGEFNLVATDSLYSKVFTTYEMVDTGTTGSYIDEDGLTVTYPIMQENKIETTKYYHPTNWSYVIEDITIEMQDERDKKKARKSKRKAMKLASLKKKANESVSKWRGRIANALEEILKDLSDE